ncbi:MAG: DUF58 domain-containing protein [Chloroflexi bacterium]|nr:DUF58 domain-containing protein [Chloroflexota bacterium]
MLFKNILRRNSSNIESPSLKAVLFNASFLRRLDRLSLPTRRHLPGYANGEDLSARQTPSSEFHDHRPYAGGDDLRHVDWNVYARHSTLFIKLGERTQSVSVSVLADCSPSMRFPLSGSVKPDKGLPATKLVRAVQLAGALGYVALSQGDRVTLGHYTNSADQILFGPVRGKRRIPELLRHLSSINPDVRAIPNAAELALPGLATPIISAGPALLEFVRHKLSHRGINGGLLVLISDLLADEGLETALRALSHSRWQVLVLHLMAPEELSPKLTGPFELEDSETHQRHSVTLDPLALEKYRQRLSDWLQSVELMCNRYGTGYARVRTDWPIEQEILPYLQRRQMLI